MADLFRRTLVFAAGALIATAAAVRVRSAAPPRPVARTEEICFAILAEGTQWEVKVMGGGMSGTWYVDVPESCRDLAPRDRLMVVDKIMRRIADGAQRTARPALASPAASLISRRLQIARTA